VHLSVVPLYWRRRLEILLHNLLGRSPAGWLQVKRAGPLVQLSIGGEHITITSIGRWKRYRRGISARLEAVAARYGAVELRDRIKGGNVIDIGANVGEFSLYCHGLGCRVFALEPDPVNFGALEANVRTTDIAAFRQALWVEEADLSFFSSVARADSSLIEPETYDRSFPVKATTLDNFTSSNGIGDIAMIKADAEGAEPEVLRGAAQTLERTRFICLDCGPERRGEKTFAECAQILDRVGFATRALDSSGHMLFGENSRFAQHG
jgi:FkbM family methyltransferase